MIPRRAPALAVFGLLLAALAAAPPLGAQEQRATVVVRARVAPLRTGLSLGPPASERTPSAARPDRREPPTGLGRGLTVRAAARFQLWVRREAADSASPLVGPASTAPRVWVRNTRGAARPLPVGHSVPLGGGPAGEHPLGGLDYRVDRSAVGRVTLVYEIRLVGEAQ